MSYRQIFGVHDLYRVDIWGDVMTALVWYQSGRDCFDIPTCTLLILSSSLAVEGSCTCLYQRYYFTRTRRKRGYLKKGSVVVCFVINIHPSVARSLILRRNPVIGVDSAWLCHSTAIRGFPGEAIAGLTQAVGIGLPIQKYMFTFPAEFAFVSKDRLTSFFTFDFLRWHMYSRCADYINPLTLFCECSLPFGFLIGTAQFNAHFSRGIENFNDIPLHS